MTTLQFLEEQQDRAVYKPEHVWCSPFTLAVLTWLSCIIGILSLLPLGEMIRSVITENSLSPQRSWGERSKQ